MIEKELKNKLDNLTKPVNSLGQLEEIAFKMGVIQNTISPKLPKDKRVYVFTSDHGIVEEGVSAFPKEVTAQMVFNFLNNGAAINVLANHVNAKVFVVDAGTDFEFEEKDNLIIKKVGKSSKNFLKEKAMTYSEAEKAIEYGKEVAEKAINEGADLLALGDMGIGNTTTATAINHALGISIEKIIDIGTVIDDTTLEKKKNVVVQACKNHSPFENPIDVLSKVGSFCFGEMVGFMLKCAEKKIPFVIDGYPVTSAAHLAYKIDPSIKNYMFVGHVSAVKGHKVILEEIGLNPILNLNMRLGEGTGAVLSFTIIESAIKILNEMASFDDANVSKGQE